jgi:ABC-type phosphate transport system substrate-binding protein
MKSILFILTLVGFTLHVGAQEAVFIVHPSVSESALTREELKSILLGNKTKWDSGNLKLVVLTEGALHEKVIHDFTQRTADQFDKYWKKLLFTGKGSMPAQAKDDAGVIDYVAKNPGALGYVDRASVANGVKALVMK